MPTIGSLFAGIGGLDLGFELAGFDCRWQVELDPYARAVLERHWPDVRRHGDVRTWPTPDAEPVDVIVGGFPCQPVSLAGKGLAQADPRWLWPEFRRVVAWLRPAWVVIENVPGLRRRGLRGVLADLADLGFDAEWAVLSAADVGAPHLRKRIFVAASDASRVELRLEPGWLGRACWQAAAESRDDGAVGPLADADGIPWNQGRKSHAEEGEERRDTDRGSLRESLADADGSRLAQREGERGDAHEELPTPERGGLASDAGRLGLKGVWAAQAARGLESSLRDLALRHGARPWSAEPDVGRVAHGVPSRVDRLRGLGNAVVPQVAEHVGRLIMEAAS